MLFWMITWGFGGARLRLRAGVLQAAERKLCEQLRQECQRKRCTSNCYSQDLLVSSGERLVVYNRSHPHDLPNLEKRKRLNLPFFTAWICCRYRVGFDLMQSREAPATSLPYIVGILASSLLSSNRTTESFARSRTSSWC